MIVIEEARITKYSGIGKYYYNLLSYLKHLNIKPVIYPKNFLYKHNAVIRRIEYFFWLNFIFVFKLFLLSLKDDVKVIGVNYFMPFIRLPRVKYYPVVHDLIAVKNSQYIPKWNAFIIKLMTENAIRNAYEIITVSETAKKEIAEYYNYPPEKIKVLYNSFSLDTKININERAVLRKYNLMDKKYILSVSSDSEHKNIKSLIIAYEKLSKKYDNLSLVLVGNNITNNNNNIICTGKIEDEELKVIYKHAKMYVFPSLCEGFGIPIIDAQQFGIPVICSDIPVFKEVAADGAKYSLTNSDDIFYKIEHLLNNESDCTDLVTSGYKNINRFKEEQILKQLVDILENNE